MDIATGASREAFEEVVNEIGLQIADQSHLHFCIDNCGRPAAEIDGDRAEGFVHRHQKISGSQDAFLRSERFIDHLAKRNADVLHRVVLIDIQIAFGRELKIEAAVMSEEFEHVIEEANSARYLIFPAPVDIQRDLNLSLFRVAR